MRVLEICLAFAALTANGCAQGTADTASSGSSPGGGGGKADSWSSGYSPSAAVAYADQHWNDGEGLCAEFTSRSLIAGSLAIDVITWVPTLVSAFSQAPYDEHPAGDSPTAAAGDVVIYSDASGADFCDDASDEYNCGHACIVATGGTGEDTITVDCHNNAHYHLGLGYILGSGYSTYRIYHLSGSSGSSGSSSSPPGTIACSSDYDCNGGQSGTEDVCADGEGYCIEGCHSDDDCPAGYTCEQTEPHWSCQ
ncbi:MAG TPA: hypothetical protein VMJ10_23840 [Kofleriaceae bacterium]|nr:hypothetical protein [Kofleriaceae bacterium]